MSKNTAVPRGFREGPFSYHQEVDLKVESLTNLGVGLARYQGELVGLEMPEGEEVSSEGWVVFVPNALPGELVKGRIWKNDKSHSQADLVEVLEPSPDRVEPKCYLFGKCGGCQYQHLSYENQLVWKRKQVGELLEHMAGVTVEVNEAIGSPMEWNYRSKITPHFHKPKKGEKSDSIEAGAIGFLQTGTRSRLIDVPQCPIAMDCINEALPKVREETRKQAATFKKGATLLLRASADGKVETNHRTMVEERVGDLKFQFLAGDFFQNNPFILPAFTGYVADQAADGGSDFLVDAYCGSGLFGLSLASRFQKVLGVEVSASSADWARHNAELNGIENATFLNASAEAIFGEVDFAAEKTTVLIDPPRKGCGPEFLDQLFAFGPRRVVYVSCNPSTQARDLRAFVEAGYQLQEVQPFDLFPQTRHLECVMVLVKG